MTSDKMSQQPMTDIIYLFCQIIQRNTGNYFRGYINKEETNSISKDQFYYIGLWYLV